jgi:hypothetical protein
LIPHYALHSPSGTLSLALGIHGPNLGIGGGLFSTFEGFVTALTWLRSGAVPGVWLVLSGWSPEFVPDHQGRPTGDCECQALALALVPASSRHPHGPLLRVMGANVSSPPLPVNLVLLADYLGRGPTEHAAVDARGSQRLSFHEPHQGSAIPRPHFLSKPRHASQAWTLGSDASGRMRVELVPPEIRREREDR